MSAEPRPAIGQLRLHQSTALVLLTKSPLHAWQAHQDREAGLDASTPAMQRGSLLDALILGNGPEIVVVDAPDWRTKAAQAARDEAIAEGKLAVLADAFEEKKAVAETLRGRLTDRGIVFDGRSQVDLEWTDPTYGTPCGGRLDHLILTERAGAIVYDLKTTVDASPEKLAMSFVRYGYDIQHAAYTGGVEESFPSCRGRVSFRFLFAEPQPPFAINIVQPAGTLRSLGEFRWKKACRVWAECLETGSWPGYESLTLLEAKPWQLTDAMEDEDVIELSR